MFRICAAYVFCLAMACCAYSQENNSFVERQVCSTNTFRFDVPKPWYYAVPDAPKKKNVARCFLHSRSRIFAKGIFLVDKGRAVGTLDETIDGLIKVMKDANTAVDIQRENVVLDGDKAVHLKSTVSNYAVPCSLIIADHQGTLYLVMMSVTKKSDLKNRDLILKTLLRTWKWKESAAKKSQRLVEPRDSDAPTQNERKNGS